VQRNISFDPLELTGRAHTHLVEFEVPRCLLHRRVAAPFRRMRAAAARDGIELAPASAFRDFDTQVRIWNDKWTGRRTLSDRHGRVLDAATLTVAERMAAILAWSAPPGASRHHWGTEIDVYDRAAVTNEYRLQLLPAEYTADGPFARLTAWLDVNMLRFGFYRPYTTDRGGVQPEPWHLSHAPTAREASRRFRLATLRSAIAAGNIEGKAALLDRLPRIYARYVRGVDPLPRSRRPRSGT
jgi:LAS superfamily LD-carboxypeptidase LdcB